MLTQAELALQASTSSTTKIHLTCLYKLDSPHMFVSEMQGDQAHLLIWHGCQEKEDAAQGQVSAAHSGVVAVVRKMLSKFLSGKRFNCTLSGADIKAGLQNIAKHLGIKDFSALQGWLSSHN